MTAGEVTIWLVTGTGCAMSDMVGLLLVDDGSTDGDEMIDVAAVVVVIRPVVFPVVVRVAVPIPGTVNKNQKVSVGQSA